VRQHTSVLLGNSPELLGQCVALPALYRAKLWGCPHN